MPYSKVDPRIRAKVKGLTMEYTDMPQPELLIPIPNPNPKTDYEIKIVSPELTSQCPLAPTQPDYATVTITYTPAQQVIELKSLKFYLVSYRNVAIFHEALAATICEHLSNTCNPKSMEVTCNFTIRGGIHTVIVARYPKT